MCVCEEKCLSATWQCSVHDIFLPGRKSQMHFLMWCLLSLEVHECNWKKNKTVTQQGKILRGPEEIWNNLGGHKNCYKHTIKESLVDNKCRLKDMIITETVSGCGNMLAMADYPGSYS